MSLCVIVNIVLLFFTIHFLVYEIYVIVVEKAAAVFSLELNNRHKLLCPWIDNACDETLALFPPTPPQSLIERYNMRSCALLKLSALPLISSSAIDYMKMKNPQLESFLSEPLHYPIDFSKSLKIVDGSVCKDMDSGLGTTTDDLFYQVCFFTQKEHELFFTLIIGYSTTANGGWQNTCQTKF